MAGCGPALRVRGHCRMARRACTAPGAVPSTRAAEHAVRCSQCHRSRASLSCCMLHSGRTMKIKFWSFEYDFDKDDAKIVVPIILLLLAVVKTSIDPAILVALAVIYYLAYFFWENLVGRVAGLIAKARLRCPECKNRKIILQGYQG